MSKTDPERIKLALQEQRLKCAQLEQALFEMRVELEKSSMEIDNELSNDFVKILDSADTKITQFMKLFWQEQRKLFTREHYRSALSPDDNQVLFISGCKESIML